MPVTTKEYITIMRASCQKLARLQVDEEFFMTLDEIRKSHARYRRHAKYLSTYPLHSSHGRDGYKNLRPAGEQLIEDCKIGKVEYLFKKIHYSNYDRFVEYIYKNTNITELIDI